MSSHWIFQLFIFLGPLSLWASPDYESALKEYNTLYEQLIEAKAQHEQSSSEQLTTINDLKQDYAGQKDIALALDGQLQQSQQNLSSLQGNLDFLKTVEPKALKAIGAVKAKAVSLGEFQNVSQVSVTSLEQKSQTLQSQVDKAQQDINDNQNKIKGIEASGAYTNLVNDKNQKVRRRDQIRQGIENSKNRLASLRWRRNDAERRLQRSKDEEIDAREKAIRIRNNRIPSEENNLRQLRRRRDDLMIQRPGKQNKFDQAKRDRDRAKDVRDTRQRELDQTNRQIEKLRQRRQNLQQQKAQADTQEKKQQIQNQINQVNSRLQNLNSKKNQQQVAVNQAQQRLTQMTSVVGEARKELLALENKISNVENDIRRKEQDIRDLERLALDFDRKAGQEEINQLHIRSEIDQLNGDINSEESQLAQLNSELPIVQNQVNQAIQALDDYRRTHIAPIEAEISQLAKRRAELQKRRLKLLTLRDQIVREEQNIALAKDRIPVQEQQVQEAQKQTASLEQEYKTAENLMVSAKARTNKAIESYNQSQRLMGQRIQEFRDKEQAALEILNDLKEKN